MPTMFFMKWTFLLCCTTGEDAPIDELVDFIVAAQIAERLEKGTDDTSCNDEVKNEVLIDSYSAVQFMTFLDVG